jgi:hypothetical protein
VAIRVSTLYESGKEMSVMRSLLRIREPGNLFFAILLLVFLTMYGCGGGGGDSANSTAPSNVTPNPGNDNSNNGVYKGVLSGSTGNLRISVRNDDPNKITLEGTFDGVTFTIAGIETRKGSNYVYTFSSGEYTMILEVSPTGSVVSNNFAYAGHSETIDVTLDKATSVTDVTCWEGTYVGVGNGIPFSGVMNSIIKGTAIASVVAGGGFVTGKPIRYNFTGTVSGNSTATSANFGGGYTMTTEGTISGSSRSGTMSYFLNSTKIGSGTFSCTKTK